MEKIDWVIAGVGAVAVLATVIGVVFYEDLAGEQDVRFASMEREVAALTGQTPNAPFQFMPGNNATGAALEVVIHHTGTARNPSGGSVRVEFTDPNGTTVQDTKSFTCGGCPSATGTQLADLTFTFDVDVFGVPADAKTTDFSSFDQTKTWMDNYVVRITITPPTDQSSALPAGGATYTFTADLRLVERYYEARLGTPDLENV